MKFLGTVEVEDGKCIIHITNQLKITVSSFTHSETKHQWNKNVEVKQKRSESFVFYPGINRNGNVYFLEVKLNYIR